MNQNHGDMPFAQVMVPEDDMQQQPENMIKSGRVINVRKLAALDIVFHGLSLF
jgi:hypothetical protein